MLRSSNFWGLNMDFTGQVKQAAEKKIIYTFYTFYTFHATNEMNAEDEMITKNEINFVIFNGEEI